MGDTVKDVCNAVRGALELAIEDSDGIATELYSPTDACESLASVLSYFRIVIESGRITAVTIRPGAEEQMLKTLIDGDADDEDEDEDEDDEDDDEDGEDGEDDDEDGEDDEDDDEDGEDGEDGDDDHPRPRKKRKQKK